MLDTTELDFVLIEDTLFCKPGREDLLTSLRDSAVGNQSPVPSV